VGSSIKAGRVRSREELGMKTAVLVLSRQSMALGRKLRDAWPGAVTLFGPSCVVGRCAGPAAGEEGSDPSLPRGAFTAGEPGLFGWRGPLRLFLPGVWERFEAIVAVMALGIVVRLAAPLLSDKRRDPAVVVVDEAGRFAISALGGHEAGANALACAVAEVLGAQAVVTTASEAQGLPAVDLIGRPWGWRIERRENLTRVAAAVVRTETIAVWQDAGPVDWWRQFGDWPKHFRKLESLASWRDLNPAGLLVISDQTLPADLPADRTIVYRPPSLVVGVGCRRGTSANAIEEFLGRVFAEQGLAEASLSALATATLKADEPGLIALAAWRGVPLLAFTPDELTAQEGVETPSERVRSKIGIAAVAEPAALRAAGAARLLVKKQVGQGITLAVARRPD
jgi:cobalt-precorrin 5A hydrolase